MSQEEIMEYRKLIEDLLDVNDYEPDILARYISQVVRAKAEIEKEDVE